MSLKTFQARLGHSTSRTTLDVYSHSYVSDGRQAAIIMDALLDAGLKSGLNGSQGTPSGGGSVVEKNYTSQELFEKADGRTRTGDLLFTNSFHEHGSAAISVIYSSAGSLLSLISPLLAVH